MFDYVIQFWALALVIFVVLLELLTRAIDQKKEAKNKFSKLVEKAQYEGPQFVTKHGIESVVVLSVEEYQKIVKPKSDLFNFIQESPLSNTSIDIKRDKSIPRDVEL
jgi:prevent-host-death family protein